MRRRKKIKVVLKPLTMAWGYAYDKAREIELDERMDDPTMLATAAHEVLHIVFPFLTEEAVDEAGREIGEVLYGLNFRRIEKGEDE